MTGWTASVLSRVHNVPGREVTLVLCTARGELIGSATPFSVENAWWRDVECVVTGAREVLGVEVRVLRILEVPRDAELPGGGRVSYLAEVDVAPPHLQLGPWPDDPLVPHPNRLGYAEPGGHQLDLDWATATLAERGIAVTGAPVQVRTWNLSSIWRLTTSAGLVWLKVTPPFCASEATVMPLLDPSVVPAVLGAAPQRVCWPTSRARTSTTPAARRFTSWRACSSTSRRHGSTASPSSKLFTCSTSGRRHPCPGSTRSSSATDTSWARTTGALWIP